VSESRGVKRLIAPVAGAMIRDAVGSLGSDDRSARSILVLRNTAVRVAVIAGTAAF